MLCSRGGDVVREMREFVVGRRDLGGKKDKEVEVEGKNWGQTRMPLS